jgi:hypothetical protein
MSKLPPGYLDTIDRMSMTLSRASGISRIMANSLLAMADNKVGRVPWDAYDLFHVMQTLENSLVEVKADMDKLHGIRCKAGDA